MMMPTHAFEIGELVRLPAQDPRVALWRISALRQSAGWVYHLVGTADELSSYEWLVEDEDELTRVET